jgi:hypothetical protein
MYLRMTTKATGLIVALIAIFLILFGALMIANSNWKPFYLNEGFTSEEALRSTVETEETIASPMEYPTDPLTEIQNPLMKIVKKLGGMSMYFANPQVWVDVYRTSKMSPTELARLNIKKEREAAAAAAASDKK